MKDHRSNCFPYNQFEVTLFDDRISISGLSDSSGTTVAFTIEAARKLLEELKKALEISE